MICVHVLSKQSNIAELLPYLSFTFVAIVAGVLVIWLPETLNHDLPDTIEEAENIGKSKKVTK